MFKKEEALTMFSELVRNLGEEEKAESPGTAVIDGDKVDTGEPTA